MPRIPRTEANNRLQMASQPTMSTDALTGPGRALQGLGKAIGSLGGAFEAASGPSDSDVLSSQLAQMDAANESQKYFTERLASLTPDMDPDQWHQDTTSGLNQIWDTNASRVPQYPKLQQGYQVNRHRFVGSFDVRAHEKATGIKTEKFAAGAIETFKGALDGVDPTTPEGLAVIDTIGKQIRRVPGIDPAKAEALLADKVIEGIEAQVATDPIGAVEKLEQLEQKWGEELRTVPPEVLQEVGPQSSVTPVLTEPQKQRLANVNPDVVDKFSLLQGKLDRTFNINSGFRYPARNARVGGANRSQHIHGNAIDIDVRDMSTAERAELILEASALGFTGIGVYKNAIHLDTGAKRAWGPTNGRNSVPSWAKDAIAAHEKGATGRPSASQVASGDVPDFRGQRAPASVRFNNPGAMYPGPSSRKFGAVGTKIIGGGHKIAVFPDAVSGAAAQFDLLSNRYTNKTLKSAIATWSGGNSVGTYLKVIERETGLAPNTVLTKEMVADPKIAIPIAKAMAVQEAGRAYPMNDAQWASAHSMFAGGGTRVASAEQRAEPTPVQSRGLTQHAGMMNVGGPQQTMTDAGPDVGEPARDIGPADDNTIPAETRVADASGLTPQQFIEQQREAQANAIPGQVRQEQPAWNQPSIRTRVLDKLQKKKPAFVKARDAVIDGYVKRVEDSAAEGYVLPEEESVVIEQRLMKYGTEEHKIRYLSAKQAAAATASMKELTPQQLAQIATDLRGEMVANGGTPETIARAKAIEGLQTKMAKELNENPLAWGIEAGVIPPSESISPDNFGPETLARRAADMAAIGEHYGPQYEKAFTPEERGWMEETVKQGGDQMLSMFGAIYDSFGDKTPGVIAEIAPKNPEAVRAGFLLATGGDPAAARDIAQTMQRRADPNYKPDTKIDNVAAHQDFSKIVGDFYKNLPPQERDATMRAAEAIYMARVDDPTVYDADMFRQSVEAAVGTRTNSNGIKFGGVVETLPGTLWGTKGDPILLPSDVRQDTFRELLDEVTVQDFIDAEHPLPLDGSGKPMSIVRALNGRMKQTDHGKYALALGDPNMPGSEKWVAATPAIPDGVSVENPPMQRFELDLNKLKPILRKRHPEMFLSE